MPFLVGYVTPQDYGAAGNGTTDDTAAINQALQAANAAGGGIVYLGAVPYLISGPIIVPPYCFLVGAQAVTLNLWSSPPSGMARLIASSSWAPSSTTGMVEIASKTPGGWSTNTQSCGVQNVVLDGSANSNTNLNGIWLNGPAYDVHLEDLFIWKVPHNGITASGQTESGITPTYPYHQRYDRVSAVQCGNVGFNLVNFTDSTYINCLAFNNASYGWQLQNVGNSILSGCRAEWQTSATTGHGFYLTGQVGELVMSGCETDQNAGYGVYVSSAASSSSTGGGIAISGGKFHGDGNGGTNTTGIAVASSTIPVAISGVAVAAAKNGASYWPTTGLSVASSSNVVVSGSVLQGTSAAWTDGGGNTLVIRRACIGVTGNTGAQTSTVLPDLPATNLFLPDDASVIAWNYDPVILSGTVNTTPTAQQVNLVRINVRVPTTVTNILMCVTTAGGTLTSGQNLAGLYNASGTLLSATADQSSVWTSTGTKTMALTSPQTVTPGTYYVGFIANGTTLPAFARATSTSVSAENLTLPAASSRWATGPTGQTTLPASITMSGVTAISASWWAALS